MTRSKRGGARTPKDNSSRSTATKLRISKRREEELERNRAAKEKGRNKLQAQLLKAAAPVANKKASPAVPATESAPAASPGVDPPSSPDPVAMPSQINNPAAPAAVPAVPGGAPGDGAHPSAAHGAPPAAAPSAASTNAGDPGRDPPAPPPPADETPADVSQRRDASTDSPEVPAAPPPTEAVHCDGKGLCYEKSDSKMEDGTKGSGSGDKQSDGAPPSDGDGAGPPGNGVEPSLHGFTKVSDPRAAALPDSPAHSVINSHVAVDLTGSPAKATGPTKEIVPPPLDEPSDEGVMNSPEKKKQRHSKKDKKQKKKKKERDKEKKLSEKRAREASPPKAPSSGRNDSAPSPSVLKSSKYGGNKSNKDDEVAFTVGKDHPHKFKRVHVDGKIGLRSEAEDEHLLPDEFVEAIQSLYANAQRIDKNIIIESKEADRHPPIMQAKHIPMNHAELSRFVSISEKSDFRRQKPWGNIKSHDADGKINPTISFTICFSTDEPIEKVLKGVKTEFQKTGGVFLREKAMASFEPDVFLRVFRMHHSNSHDTIDHELSAILHTSRERAEKDDKFYKYGGSPVPEFQQRWNTPQIPGLNSKMFEHWPDHLKRNRNVPHFEVDSSNLEHALSLVEMGKKYGIFKHVWGERVHVSAFYKKAKLSGSARKALAEFSTKHVEVQESFTMDCLVGVVSLDKPIPICDTEGNEMGNTTLRQVLYSQYTMSNGVPLCWEIHQCGELADVDVVRAKSDEARFTIEQMNKNIAAYLTHDLVANKKMPKLFVEALVSNTIEPTLVNEIEACKWDNEKKTIWTPRDAEMEAAKAHENAQFYINIDALLISGKGKSNSGREDQRKASAREMQKFNDAGSFATLNVRGDADGGGKGYSGDLGVPVFSLGKAKATADASVDGGQDYDIGNKGDGVSALSGTSGVSSSRREVAKLQQELAEAMAKIKTLSEPRLTASRKESGSSSVESLANSTSSSDSSSSSAPSSIGSDESGPGADFGS